MEPCQLLLIPLDAQETVDRANHFEGVPMMILQMFHELVLGHIWEMDIPSRMALAHQPSSSLFGQLPKRRPFWMAKARFNTITSLVSSSRTIFRTICPIAMVAGVSGATM